MTIEEFILTLTTKGCEPKQNTNGWIAKCPAHDDQTPSLSVGIGNEGKILLHCHAGCSIHSICHALGIPLSALMSERQYQKQEHNKINKSNPVFKTANDAIKVLRKKFGQESRQWVYMDSMSHEIGYVIRWDSPQHESKIIFPVSKHANGWKIGAMPTPRPLYHLPEIIIANPSSPVFVVEGEKCADVLASIGFVTTTSSGGAHAASKTDWTPLLGRKVIILPDNDEPGKHYAQDVANLCYKVGITDIKILHLAKYASKLTIGGDIVDIMNDPEWCGLDLGDAADQQNFSKLIIDLAEKEESWQPESRFDDAKNKSEWPELVPFDGLNLPEFPVHALPTVLREWVEAESHATQTPPDISGLLSLAVCSSCIARRVVVEPRPGWCEPVNLFVMILLEPGNRKSTVFADGTTPLRQMEAELIEAERPKFVSDLSEYRQNEMRLRKLEKIAAERGNLQAAEEAKNLAVRMATMTKPVLPQLIVDDATPEKLSILLAEQGGRIASMSPEAGVLDVLSGLYSKNGAPYLNVYLMGHSGDTLRVDRVSRESIHIQRPALTCAYVIQPEGIRQITEQDIFRGRGLLARFLYAMPKSWIGQRLIAPEPVSPTIRNAYYETVRGLASKLKYVDTLSEPITIRLTLEAQQKFQAWEAEIETMLNDGEAMELIRDWGAKLAGATLRLAAVLHCVKHDVNEYINENTIVEAIKIAKYLIPHAETVLTSVLHNGNKVHNDARYVLRWIKRHKKREFSKREAYKDGKRRFSHAEDIDAALTELVRRGYIRQKTMITCNPGRPASPIYEVNPIL